MKLRALTLATFLIAGLPALTQADDAEVLATVMQDGLKDKAGPFAKIKEGTATGTDYTELYEMVRLMRGTKAPVGEQAAYDEKVEALIRASGATAYVEPSDASLETLKKAANCKACHNDHKAD